MASAFNTSNMKAQFPNIRLACGQLIDILKSLKGDAAVDMDSALCRESLDVIGMLLTRTTVITRKATRSLGRKGIHVGVQQPQPRGPAQSPCNQSAAQLHDVG